MSQSKSYYNLNASEICESVKESHKTPEKVQISGIELFIHPNVYPSHEFRTTKFVLRNIEGMLKNKNVCDMGCGPGVVGLFAVKHGARRVVQADINPQAVENAKANNEHHGFSQQVIETFFSDCFENIPVQTFDIIVFNMPYHNDDIEIKDPLQRAFYDPKFHSIKKFLTEAEQYTQESSRIFIAFSSKGDCLGLEKIFDESCYQWELWKIINSDTKYDNRIYSLRKK